MRKLVFISVLCLILFVAFAVVSWGTDGIVPQENTFESLTTNSFVATVAVANISHPAALVAPTVYNLSQNYPNPFNNVIKNRCIELTTVHVYRNHITGQKVKIWEIIADEKFYDESVVYFYQQKLRLGEYPKVLVRGTSISNSIIQLDIVTTTDKFGPVVLI